FRVGWFRRRRHSARLNLERVMIGMSFYSYILANVLPGIIRHEQREPEHVHALVIRGVDTNLAEIKWAWVHGAHSRPRLASVLGTKNATAFAAKIVERTEASFVTLHNCHHDFCIAGADRQTNSASLTRKTAAELFPACAAVSALKNSANVFTPGHARSRSETPRRASPRVQHRVKDL